MQEIPQKQEKKRGRKKKELMHQREEDLPEIYYYPEPTLVDKLNGENKKNIVDVFAGGHYCYALEGKGEGEID